MIERLNGDQKKKVGGWANVKSIVYDTVNRVIHIYGLTGGMDVDVDTYDRPNDFGAIAVSITKASPSQKDDSELSDEEYVKQLVWESKCFLNNGKLSTVGAITPRHFSHRVEGNKLATSLNVAHLVIPIPTGIEMNTLIVNVGVDNGN